jgi:Flp pilus assembly CpaE family ATPase
MNGVERSRVKLLVNRYTPSIALKREDVEKALEVPVHSVLANDYASIQTALLDGKPAPRTSSFGRSISQLAARLADGAAGPASKADRRWFRRSANK